MTKKLLIAGGGTGGHIFPGIAVAEEWRRRGGEVVFVGTSRGQEGTLVPRHGFALRFLEVGTLKGQGLVRKIKTLAGLPVALWKALKILREEKPDAVLGIGGYASGPLCVAAFFRSLKTAITDQNAHPGLTNRLLGKVVRKVYLAFDRAARFFNTDKVSVTGNPVRSQITYVPYELPRDEWRIFVFGGSQGAHALNENFIKAVEDLREFWSKLNIVHQTGKDDVESVRQFYEKNGIVAVVDSFFDDMNSIYQKCHLVICRSGAGTVTELALSGRPAIFVPYPYAADDHQLRNAEIFVDQGAAWVIEQKDLTPEKLAALLKDFFNHPEDLKRRSERMRSLAKPEAAKTIVDELMA